MHQKLLSTLSLYQHIILVGGGTGGHIQPILNIVSELQGEKLLWIGGEDSYEKQAAEDAKIDFESIPILKLTSTKSPRILLYPIVLIRGILAARKILKRMANIQGNGYITVFSKGGPGSVAVGIAAWSLSIPLYIHESDTIPGRSNRILGRFAMRVFLGFESAKTYFDTKKCEVIGQILHPMFGVPLSRGMASYEPRGLVSEKSEQNPSTLSGTSPGQGDLNWKTSKPHILVICGSQGSQVIFEEIIKNFSGNNRYEWIISLGKLNTGMRKNFEKMANIQALEWISQENIAHLIQDTDIAITRGSATTLAELTAFEKKPRLIIIPLPYAAHNHQYYNALEYEKMGHILLEQKNISQLTKLL